MQVFLGVDGGGTQTRSRLVDEHGSVLGRGLAGSSNLHQIDAATFRANLHSVVTQAFAELDPDSIELSAACFGLAGVSSSKAHEQAQAVIAELKLSPVATISILTDAHIALTGGLAGAPGIVLLAGTGSACFGNDAEGKLCRTGGWGSIEYGTVGHTKGQVTEHHPTATAQPCALALSVPDLATHVL